MRHRVAKRHFNRDTKHRSSMLTNLLRALFENGALTTTLAKAKEIKRQADKMIGTAKEGTLAAKRQLHSRFGKRDVVNTLVDRIAPLNADRVSGFTTLEVLGKRRGDNAILAKLSLLHQPELNKTLKAPSKPKEETKKPVVVKKAAAKVTTKITKKVVEEVKKPAKVNKPITKTIKKVVKNASAKLAPKTVTTGKLLKKPTKSKKTTKV